MPPPVSPPSVIPPFRSVVYLWLVIVSLSLASTSIFNPGDYLPGSLVMAIEFGLATTCLYCIAGSYFLTMSDRTEYRAAMDSHFTISMLVALMLCFGKVAEKVMERVTVKVLVQDVLVLCSKWIMWAITLGMVSAIWMRGGLQALKREVMAVPGNLWIILYEGRM